MPEHSAPMPDPDLDARQIRLLADDELSAEETALAQASLAGRDDAAAARRAQLVAERQLHEAVHRVMSVDKAPEFLRAQIEQAFTQSRNALEALNEDAAAIAGRIDSGSVVSTSRRESWMARMFASPQRASVLAVAAVLALILGAVLFGIYGRTIDDVPVLHGVDVVGNVAQYC